MIYVLFVPFLALMILAVLRRGERLAQGMGWVILIGGLAGVSLQAWWLFGSGQTRYSMDGSYVLALPVAWWATISGGLVQALFEETASKVGPRPVTMSPWWYFYGLVWLKVLVLGLLVRKALGMPTLARRAVLGLVAVGLVVDAWFGRDWPWWGT